MFCSIVWFGTTISRHMGVYHAVNIGVQQKSVYFTGTKKMPFLLIRNPKQKITMFAVETPLG